MPTISKLTAVMALAVFTACGAPTETESTPPNLTFCRAVSALNDFSPEPEAVRAAAAELRVVFDDLAALPLRDVPDEAEGPIRDLRRIAGYLAIGDETLVQVTAADWTTAHRQLADAVRDTCGELPTFLDVPVAQAPTTSEPPVYSSLWPDLPLRTLCVDIAGTWQGQPVTTAQAEEAAHLRSLGLSRGLELAAPGSACEATLTVRFDGTARSAPYEMEENGQVVFSGDLFVGASIVGTVQLSAPGREPLTVTETLEDTPEDTEWMTGGDLPVEPIDAMYTHLARWVNSALEQLGLA